MTHDKLCELAAGCPCRKWIPEEVECENCFCDCANIAKVREDQRAACIAAIQADGLGAEWRVERIIKLLGEV